MGFDRYHMSVRALSAQTTRRSESRSRCKDCLPVLPRRRAEKYSSRECALRQPHARHSRVYGAEGGSGGARYTPDWCAGARRRSHIDGRGPDS
jgi:hypothetical protein